MSGLVSAALLDRVRTRLALTSDTPTAATVAAAIRAESSGVLGDTDLLDALRTLQTELTGAGVLESLLTQPDVSDVLVTAPDEVWVDRGHGLERADVDFADEAAVRRLAQRLALAAGRRLDDAQPWVDGRLPGTPGANFGVRLHAVLSPVAQAGTCLSLRVLRPATQGLDVLHRSGTLSDEAYELLQRIITSRLAFLVVGGTGAGNTGTELKHTMTRWLGDCNYRRDLRSDQPGSGRHPGWDTPAGRRVPRAGGSAGMVHRRCICGQRSVCVRRQGSTRVREAHRGHPLREGPGFAGMAS